MEFPNNGVSNFFRERSGVSQTLSGLFLIGAVNRPTKRKRTNRDNPRTNRENPGKIGKVPKRTKGGTSQIGKLPCLKPARLPALVESKTSVPASLKFRKILVSVKFVSAILGPEMAAPILWTPGKNASVLQEKPCP